MINVWPALADLMTVLSVPGLFTAVGLLPYFVRNDSGLGVQRVLASVAPRAGSPTTVAPQPVGTVSPGKSGGPGYEPPLNPAMFRSTQAAQRVIDLIRPVLGFQFTDAQTLEPGPDLFSFRPGSDRLQRTENSRLELSRFCSSLVAARELARRNGLALETLFVLEIEGHADSVPCQVDPGCNWKHSVARATAMREELQREPACQLLSGWRLRLVGYADTKPPPPSPQGPLLATRGVRFRLAPDYEAILQSQP